MDQGDSRLVQRSPRARFPARCHRHRCRVAASTVSPRRASVEMVVTNRSSVSRYASPDLPTPLSPTEEHLGVGVAGGFASLTSLSSNRRQVPYPPPSGHRSRRSPAAVCCDCHASHVPVWPSRVARHWPAARSHTRTVLSWSRDVPAARPAVTATPYTEPVPGLRGLQGTDSTLPGLHTRTVPSLEPR